MTHQEQVTEILDTEISDRTHELARRLLASAGLGTTALYALSLALREQYSEAHEAGIRDTDDSPGADLLAETAKALASIEASEV